MGVKGTAGKQIAITFFSFLILWMGFAVVSALFLTPGDLFPFDDPLPLLFQIAGPLATLGFVTWYMRRSGGTWQGLGFEKPSDWGHTIKWVAIIYAAATVFYLFIGPLVDLVTGSTPDVSALAPLEGNLTGLLGFMVYAVAMAGLLEELFFRGYLMSRFETLFGGGKKAMVWAAISQATLFGLLHSYQGIAGMIRVMGIGLIMAFAYYNNGRKLVPLIIAHLLIDYVAFFFIYRGWEFPTLFQ